MASIQPTPAITKRVPLPVTPIPADELNPMRSVVFFFAMLLVFVRFSMFHQLSTTVLGINLYLLYLVGVPALFGIVTTGGIRRTLQGKPGFYWLMFAVWLLISVPFSAWRAASFSMV